MENIRNKFGHKIRLRVCGLVFDQEKILLINHTGLNAQNEFWAPPGGGVEYGESTYQALQREMLEEANIKVTKAELSFVNEFIDPPLHAVEFFYKIHHFQGSLKLGGDPEMGGDEIIKELKFVTFQELRIMEETKKHNILQDNVSFNQLITLSGINLFRPDQ